MPCWTVQPTAPRTPSPRRNSAHPTMPIHPTTLTSSGKKKRKTHGSPPAGRDRSAGRTQGRLVAVPGSALPVGRHPVPGRHQLRGRRRRGARRLRRAAVPAGSNVPGGTVRTIPMDERTYGIWHTFVPDVGPGQVYGFRVPARDPAKILLDPYARQVTSTDYDLIAAASSGVRHTGQGPARRRLLHPLVRPRSGRGCRGSRR